MYIVTQTATSFLEKHICYAWRLMIGAQRYSQSGFAVKGNISFLKQQRGFSVSLNFSVCRGVMKARQLMLWLMVLPCVNYEFILWPPQEDPAAPSVTYTAGCVHAHSLRFSACLTYTYIHHRCRYWTPGQPLRLCSHYILVMLAAPCRHQPPHRSFPAMHCMKTLCLLTTLDHNCHKRGAL